MNTGEIVALVVSVGAVVFAGASSCFSFFTWREAKRAGDKAEEANQNSEKANELASQANDIARVAAGETEEAMRERISNRWDKFNEILEKINNITKGKDQSELSATKKKQVQSLGKSVDSNAEALLNMYETVCGRYRDGTCNKERFKKLFVEEIKQLCETESRISKILNLGPTTKYKAIQYVYQEWHDLESRIKA